MKILLIKAYILFFARVFPLLAVSGKVPFSKGFFDQTFF